MHDGERTISGLSWPVREGLPLRVRAVRVSWTKGSGGSVAAGAQPRATHAAWRDRAFPIPAQTTFCDSTLRISRGVPRFPNAPAEMRVFARENVEEDQWGSWQEEEDAKTQASTSAAAELQSEAPVEDDPYENYFDEMPD